ncbi:MAG: TIGR04552 family protein [Deltaproteobacteria bacterium]|nr:TIGR04552 family protein [Deltaproteobacteria bacterium]
MLVQDRKDAGIPTMAVSNALSRPGLDLTPALQRDLAALRLALSGESVIDMARMAFDSRASVDHFLRLNQFDTDNPLDLARLKEIHQEAVGYLADIHHLRLPAELERPAEIHEVFLAANRGPARLRRTACMMLKVMHIIHHLSGRELTFAIAVSEAQLFERLSARVFTEIERMRAAGIDVVEFAGGKKSRTSLVSKLLARRSTVTAHVFDKLRFSVTLRSEAELVRALIYLGHNLFPFNFVVPEQSRNKIVTPQHVATALGLDPGVVEGFWAQPGAPGEPLVVPESNEFSGAGYRAVSMVIDIPIRIDDLAPSHTPAIAFVETEIQLVDVKTALANSQGDSSHAAYKKRQLARVRARLLGNGDGDEIAN